MSEPRIDRLTASQRHALAAELAELEGPKRTAAIEAIKTAREHGDLSENFEYHAAKDEQGNRIQGEISSLGGNGTISPDSPLGRALVGHCVGDAVDVDAPRGKWIARILSIRRS